MSRYVLMGGDGKEYGPVDADQVREWIWQERLEKKSPVMVEGSRDWVFLESLPEFTDAWVPPMIGMLPKEALGAKGGGLNAIIPYRNPKALTSYYFGVFSVIPVLGILLGLIAFVLGILGLRYRSQRPGTGGAVHAWIGILAGGFFAALWLGLSALIFVLKFKHH